jgi:hypothetical protein
MLGRINRPCVIVDMGRPDALRSYPCQKLKSGPGKGDHIAQSDSVAKFRFPCGSKGIRAAWHSL